MKNKILILLSTLLCITLVSCNTSAPSTGSSADKETEKEVSSEQTDTPTEVYAAVTKNDGDTASATSAELIEIFNSNQANFNKYYTDAGITITAKIESISKNRLYMSSDSTWASNGTVIVLEGGWCIVNVPQDLADICAGDSVEVAGNIITATTHDMLKVHGPTGSDPVVWIDGSTGGVLSSSSSADVDVNALSSAELIELFNSNEARFNKYCTGKTITKKSVIKAIALDKQTMISDNEWKYSDTVVIFEDGWCLVNPPQDIADYMPGDTVEFSGNIITATTHTMLKVHGPTGSDPVVWVDGSSYGIIG